MKKLFRCVPLLLVVASLGCFSMLGCGGGGATDGDAPSVEEAEEPDEVQPGDDPIDPENI